jgi:putative redox protein
MASAEHPTPPAPTVVELTWLGGRRFTGQAGPATMRLDAADRADPTPVQALAFALAGCMAMDVVDILETGHLAVAGLRVRLVGERVAEFPRRFARFDLHLTVAGDLPADRVERAVALSRERYCTVWHSLRPDIELRTACTVEPAT